MPIITISRQKGSLGDEIAKAVADKLGYDIIGKSKISEFLSNKGFEAPDLEKYDEKKPSVWQSLSIQNKKFSHLIRAAVLELAARDNVVIVGRGGQAILRGYPGILHVKVIAPYATRAGRLVAREGYDEKNVEHIIDKSDHDRYGYTHSYFRLDWDDKDLYDLIVNTRTMSSETCVELIIRASEADEFKKSPQEDRNFSDLALIQKVEAAIVGIPGLEIAHIGVEKGGVVLSGSAKSSAARDDCEKAVMTVEGIEKVNNQLEVHEKKRPRIL